MPHTSHHTSQNHRVWTHPSFEKTFIFVFLFSSDPSTRLRATIRLVHLKVYLPRYVDKISISVSITFVSIHLLPHRSLPNMKPRYLFFALFACYAVPGRFYPLFLYAYGQNAAEIGTLLSLRSLANLLATPVISDRADRAANHETYIIRLTFMTIIALLAQILALPSFSLVQSSIWTFLWLFLTTSVFMVSSIPLNNLVTAVAIRNLRCAYAEAAPSYYGRERLWGAVSWALVSVLFGAALDLPNVDFHLVYFVYPPLALAFALTVHVFRHRYNLSQNNESDGSALLHEHVRATPHQHLSSQSQQALSSFQMWAYFIRRDDGLQSILFFTLVFALSVGTTVIANMQFLFFVNDLSASNFTCGILVLVTVVFEIPLFAIAPSLLQKLGPGCMVVIAAVGYVIRAITYVVVHNVTTVIWVEPLHGVTYAIMQVASVAYVGSRAPPEAEASAQAVIASCRAAGSIFGSSIGGLIYQYLGARSLFLITAIFVSSAGIAFTVVSFVIGRTSSIASVSEENAPLSTVSLSSTRSPNTK